MYERAGKFKDNKNSVATNSITKNKHSVKQRFKFVNDSLGTKNQNLLQCQLPCSKCGSKEHKTSKCTMTKQQMDQHKAETKAFHEAKKRTLVEMPKVATTSAFSKKHLVPPGTTMGNASRLVASTRTWGGGGQAGTSTVVKMSAEDQHAEARFMMERLKMNESRIVNGKLVPNMGVNKQTRFVYATRSARVTSDEHGKRTIKEQRDKYAHPVLGLRGAQIHHLHGVEEE
ncbi:hypothetical protein EHE19_014360 [Ruminiclostridium herbifermentans]|uniref:Uncharacterized protein n=1 Tax=Ruminiclostridium herbifermentans TaxID=2488810 RepID=A0A4U7JLE1_9FIRM|nr:hypothetical protein [Ruminiclostridium herbifermentans]QNU66055.1 hypothetical protein EHE19_014360 [Ruminiclostridium herbifermentans]